MSLPWTEAEADRLQQSQEDYVSIWRGLWEDELGIIMRDTGNIG